MSAIMRRAAVGPCPHSAEQGMPIDLKALRQSPKAAPVRDSGESLYGC
ncbi:hypothetical protein J7355_11530 [Endozoicomonas sp. G2_2]|nr:hypothetical protein [Endozoicomonas sp. G2_2]MBO9470733.1 hypothetical protein [Endozoicomonas sp. G2_2]